MVIKIELFFLSYILIIKKTLAKQKFAVRRKLQIKQQIDR